MSAILVSSFTGFIPHGKDEKADFRMGKTAASLPFDTCIELAIEESIDQVSTGIWVTRAMTKTYQITPDNTPGCDAVREREIAKTSMKHHM